MKYFMKIHHLTAQNSYETLIEFKVRKLHALTKKTNNYFEKLYIIYHQID